MEGFRAKSGGLTVAAAESQSRGLWVFQTEPILNSKFSTVAGKDNLANRESIYDNTSDETAEYVITGTTLSNKLGLIGFIH